MKIPLIKPDLPTLEEIRGPLTEILENGRITNFGRYVQQFESDTAKYLGTHTATVSSGTMGLILALLACGLRPGQKVILPSFSFVATAQAVLFAGGVPVFADVEDDLNISPVSLADLVRKHHDIGAVVAVHMYGLPAKTNEIQEIMEHASNGNKIPVIFDAAHAFGASVQGTKIGCFGDIEVFSLSVTKALVTVEGGLVSTRNPELIERIKHMRNYGIYTDYNAHWPGLNGKMSELHAIVGLSNLRRLDALLSVRHEKANYFRERIQQETPFRNSPWPAGVCHTFKDLTILVENDAGAERRDRVMHDLAEKGIETRAYFYPPLHEQTYFRRFGNGPLPNTERLARQVITLPFYTTITCDEMDYVVQALAQVA